MSPEEKAQLRARQEAREREKEELKKKIVIDFQGRRILSAADYEAPQISPVAEEAKRDDETRQTMYDDPLLLLPILLL